MLAVYGDALAKLARMDVLVVGLTGTGAETGMRSSHLAP